MKGTRGRPVRNQSARGGIAADSAAGTECRIGPRFGAHMSIAGGMHRAFELAAAAGCDCLQVFVKNQRQWKARPLRPDEIEAWRSAAVRTGIGPVVAHATYLINLASPDPTGWRRSIDAYHEELLRCEQLGIGGLVVHPGSHLGAGEWAGCRRVGAALREVLDRLGDARVRPVLEITAGQGSSLGWRFEHIGDILEQSRAATRVGVCFDTCHALAAGYRFDSGETYADTIGQLDQVVGLGHVACFHLNDSQRPRGSRVDRHAHIGRGYVGVEGFRRIVQDRRFGAVPMILETPKGRDPRGRDFDRLNLAKLRRLAGVVSRPSRCGSGPATPATGPSTANRGRAKRPAPGA